MEKYIIQFLSYPERVCMSYNILYGSGFCRHILILYYKQSNQNIT